MYATNDVAWAAVLHYDIEEWVKLSLEQQLKLKMKSETWKSMTPKQQTKSQVKKYAKRKPATFTAD